MTPLMCYSSVTDKVFLIIDSVCSPPTMSEYSPVCETWDLDQAKYKEMVGCSYKCKIEAVDDVGYITIKKIT